MVSAVVAASLSDVIDRLLRGDLATAQNHTAKLLTILDDVPASTSELIGHDGFSALQHAVEQAFWEIQMGDPIAAARVFQSALSNWYETYPPYLA